MNQEQARAQLQAMFDERKAREADYSLARFGQDLARMIGRQEPYKKQYLYAVMRGQAGYKVSAELQDGLTRLGMVADGIAEWQAKLQAVPGNVLSLHPVHAGAVVLGQSKQCPTCGLWFHSETRRRYCPRCRPPRTRK